MRKINTPQISVIIPAYNEEKTISSCLKNIINQDFSNKYEVLVVNGPSTDNTESIVKKFPVKLVNLHERGIGMAWDTGVKRARGEIIAFTEADTIVPNNWLSTIYNKFNENIFASGLVGRYYFKNRSWFTNFFITLSMSFFDTLSKVIFGHYCFRGTNFAVKKTALIKAGGFNKKVPSHGDVELSRRFSKIGAIVYVPDLIVFTDDRIVSSPINTFKFLKRFIAAVTNIFILNTPEKTTNLDIRK